MTEALFDLFSRILTPGIFWFSILKIVSENNYLLFASTAASQAAYIAAARVEHTSPQIAILSFSVAIPAIDTPMLLRKAATLIQNLRLVNLRKISLLFILLPPCLY